MKCKLCEKPGVTIFSLERDWPEPKPQFAWGEKQSVAKCWLCPDHNWRAADINLALRRSLLGFRIKVNKGLDSFPESLDVSISTLLVPDENNEVIIHRVPKDECVEVNHIGFSPTVTPDAR